MEFIIDDKDLAVEVAANLAASQQAYSNAINKSVSGSISGSGTLNGAVPNVYSRTHVGSTTNWPPVGPPYAGRPMRAHDWNTASFTDTFEHICTVNEFDVAIEYMFGYCTECKKEVRLTSSPVSRAETRARKLTEEYLESRLAGLIADDDVGFQETVNELALLELLLEVDQDRIELARRLLGIVKKGILASLGVDE